MASGPLSNHGIKFDSDMSGQTGIKIYNNTIYTAAASGACFFLQTVTGTYDVAIYNNIFYAAGTGTRAFHSVHAATSATMVGNCYYAPSNPTSIITWVSTNYTSVANWLAAVTTKERVGAIIQAISDNPLLANAGGSADVNYQLQGTSPCRGVGQNLTSILGLTSSPDDYFGNLVPGSDGLWSIGAHDVSTGQAWYASDVPSAAWYGTATQPHAVYHAGTDKIWLSHQSWNGIKRSNSVVVYDRAAASWAGPYIAAIDQMVDDDHGVPAICRDHQGYWHIFGGAHNVALHSSRTLNPDDPTVWVEDTGYGPTGTYPHPSFVGGVIYVFIRSQTDRHLRLHKTTALSGGVATWATVGDVGDMGSSTRWYQGNHIVRGTDTHMVACRANAADTLRQHVFYLRYDTVNLRWTNFDGSVTDCARSLKSNRA